MRTPFSLETEAAETAFRRAVEAARQESLVLGVQPVDAVPAAASRARDGLGQLLAETARLDPTAADIRIGDEIPS